MVAFKWFLKKQPSEKALGSYAAYLGEDETVIVYILQILLLVFHDVEEQHGHDLGSATGGCRVA